MNLDNTLLVKALVDDRLQDAQLRRRINAVTGPRSRHHRFTLLSAIAGRKAWPIAELQNPTT